MEEAALQEIVRLLKEMNGKLGRISQRQELMLENLDKSSAEARKKPIPVDVDTLLSLPDHLRISLQKLMELKSGTAEEVAAKTGRTRAAESDYLNQLLRKNYLRKERRGRTVFFSVE